MAQPHLTLVPAFFLAVALAACGSDGLPGGVTVGGASATSGSTGNPSAGTPGSGGSGNGTAGAAGTTPGGAGSSAAGASAAGASSAGAAGTGTGGTGSAGAGSAGAGGAPPFTNAKGKSAGCSMPPPGSDSQMNFVLHTAKITAPLDPVYVGPDGAIFKKQAHDPWNFQNRPYSVKLPKNYDSSKTYAVTLAGGGCGGNVANFASNPGGQYQLGGDATTIQVGLMYLDTCFADGGSGISFRSDTPEVPYVRQVIADVEANYCVDKSLVFITGTSSGGWESFTVGCGAADVIRGIGPVSGGLRLHRPACAGPQASIMVEGKGDTANPIGPQTPPNTDRDSPGSAPARDEILKRNGCVAPDFQFTYTDINGSAPHTQWDAKYPTCVKYTGCPAATPVVWCALDGGHQVDNETINGVKTDYKAGIFKFFADQPPL